MAALSPIAQRFPLVPRKRPACQPLDMRVREVHDLAQHAADGPVADRLASAAAAHNKAALIASDSGLPGLARALCWQQFHVYTRTQPLTADAARHALEPLVNLARLLIRGGEGQSAHRLLDTLYRAVMSRTAAVIDGTPVSLRDLIRSAEDHRTLCQWLWTVVLADGTRALARAGRWDQAFAHAKRHRGVGQRLLDGRQVAVLARCAAGDPAAALALLDDSAIIEPWERPVAACLTVLCLNTPVRPAGSAITAMAQSYLGLNPVPELLMFRTHLGLTVIDLACGVEQPAVAQAATRLVGETVAAADGYAARDLLAHRGCRKHLTGADERSLRATVQSCGLGRGDIPATLKAKLLSAVAMSEAATARSLTTEIPDRTHPRPAVKRPLWGRPDQACSD